jgi:colicin import membrane protein
MSTTALPADRDALLPQRPGGLGLGALLALLAHGVLLVGLTLGVRWRTSEPEGITAELWAATPQIAAAPAAETAPPPPPAPPPPAPPPPKPVPKVVEPPPPPKDLQKDAQIAIEKAEREKKELLKEQQKLEKDKLEQEKRERLKAEQEQARKEQALKEKADRILADEHRLAKLREENLKRMLGQAGATGAPGSTGNALRDAGPSASYAGRVIARIRPNIVLTAELSGDPKVEVEVRTAPDGTILGRRVVKPSGQAAWDEAVLRAIDRTEVLPRDVDGRVPPLLLLVVNPRP